MHKRIKRRKYTLVFTILVVASSGLNAGKISGKLHADSTWNRVVYLSLIPVFDQINSMSNQMIIESAELNKNGYFEFNTEYLPAENKLYRIHFSKTGDPPASLIIGGKDENHMFFIAQKNSAIAINNNNSETLFSDITISNSPQSQLINEVNKMLLYVDTTSFYNTPLKRELMENALNEKLRQFADTCSYPLAALYAVYKSDFENHFRLNPDFYVRFLKKWKKERSPYFNEFRRKIQIKATHSYSILYAFFGLLAGALLMLFLGKAKIKTSKNLLYDLTVQERNIFALLQQGKSNKEIGEELNVSLSTVKSHVNSIFSKLSIKSRKEILNF